MSCGGRTCDLSIQFCNEDLRCSCKPGRDPAFGCDDLGQDCNGCKDWCNSEGRCDECADGWTRTNGYCVHYLQDCPCPSGQYCWNFSICKYCPTGWTNDESHTFCVPIANQAEKQLISVSNPAFIAGIVGGVVLLGCVVFGVVAALRGRKAHIASEEVRLIDEVE